MNKLSKTCAVVCTTIGLAGSAQATTTTLDFENVEEVNGVFELGGDFIADDIRIVSGNCSTNPGDCAAFNANGGELTTISRSSGLGFAVNSFFVDLLGNNANVVVNFLNQVGGSLSTQTITEVGDDGSVVTSSFTDEIFAISFTNLEPGNSRVDDLDVTPSAVAAVPLPAGGLLLLGGLGGLTFMRRRKAA